jgi:hypothetical protein
MTLARVPIGIAAIVVALIGVLAVATGPWFGATHWHVYGQESTRTTAAQERFAMRCAPSGSTVIVLESSPAQIDIAVRGSASRADHIAECLRHSAGIAGATTVRSQ